MLERLILPLSCLLLSPAICSAADFRTASEAEGNCSFWLEGEIARNDAKRFAKFIAENFEEARLVNVLEADLRTFVICLSSPGGSFAEAFMIQDLIHYGLSNYGYSQIENWPLDSFGGFGTYVPSNRSCESACAVAFLGGNFAWTLSLPRVPLRMIDIGSRLGFHAPKLDFDAVEDNIDTLSLSYSAAVNEIAVLIKSSQLLEVPGWIIADFIGTPPEEMFYIDTIEKANALSIYVVDFPKLEKPSPGNHLQACIQLTTQHADSRAIFATRIGTDADRPEASNGEEKLSFDGRFYSLEDILTEVSIFDIFWNRYGLDAQNSYSYSAEPDVLDFVIWEYEESLNCIVKQCEHFEGEKCYSLVDGNGSIAYGVDEYGSSNKSLFPPSLSFDKVVEVTNGEDIVDPGLSLAIETNFFEGECSVVIGDQRGLFLDSKDPCKVGLISRVSAELSETHSFRFTWPSGSLTIVEFTFDARSQEWTSEINGSPTESTFSRLDSLRGLVGPLADCYRNSATENIFCFSPVTKP